MECAAAITAGGRVDGDFARTIGTDVKALAPFCGATLLSRTIAALRELGIGRIAVIGGAEVRAACAGDVENFVEESASGSENLLRALHAWDDATPLLYLTSDMPFITSHALRTFVNAVPSGTLALPLTEWPQFQSRFPGAPPFGITLAGEKVVNGGAFMIPPGAAGNIEQFAVRFFDARKSIWQMARLTGPVLLAQFVFRRLGVAQLETHAGRLLGIPARAIRNAPPELAYDVDVLEEYRYALERASHS
jgi:CTP:molybdopterin cytidylyltransferase MocA